MSTLAHEEHSLFLAGHGLYSPRELRAVAFILKNEHGPGSHVAAARFISSTPRWGGPSFTSCTGYSDARRSPLERSCLEARAARLAQDRQGFNTAL